MTAQPYSYTADQRSAFQKLLTAIEAYRTVADYGIKPGESSEVVLQEFKDAVWQAALGVCCRHLLFVLTDDEKHTIKECVPQRVLLTRPLTVEEKEGRDEL
jgi:hypothetical protein